MPDPAIDQSLRQPGTRSEYKKPAAGSLWYEKTPYALCRGIWSEKDPIHLEKRVRFFSLMMDIRMLP